MAWKLCCCIAVLLLFATAVVTLRQPPANEAPRVVDLGPPVSPFKPYVPGEKRTFSIPEGSLDNALYVFFSQARLSWTTLQTPYLQETHVPALNGTYEPMEALSLMLQGTRCTYKFDKVTRDYVRCDCREMKDRPDANHGGSL